MDTADALTLAVAVYAALVATFVAWVQVWTRRTRMEVKPARMSIHQPASSPEADEEVVLMTLTNHSEHPVRVTHLSFAAKEKGRRLVVPRPFPVHEPVPIRVEPRDSKVVWVGLDVIDDALDKRGKVEVSISTSDGRTFSSGRVYLEPWKHWNWRRPWRQPLQLDRAEEQAKTSSP
jgi:hypothetical protein